MSNETMAAGAQSAVAPRSERPVLYLTHDGVLQPLCYSQVVRPILALASRGVRYALVSLERSADLADVESVRRLEQRLAEAGVTWSYARFRPGAARYPENLVALAAHAARLATALGVSAIHARGFPVGAVALALHGATGAPILYDIRGFWIDNRIEVNGVLANPLVLRLARFLEAKLYRRSAAVVSLTELGLDIIRSGHFGRHRSDQLGVCIPTCVDYDEFRLREPGRFDRAPTEVVERLRGRLVVGFVGSINADYCVSHTLRLFRQVRERRRDALLLCLTEQGTELREIARREGVHEDALVFHRAHHEDMPSWLERIDWGLLLLVERFAKFASVPTKLGEFFASGVRPLFYGCNPEVRSWVSRAGSGHVLPDLSDPSLRQAAEIVASSVHELDRLKAARQRTRDHFDLATGVDRYEDVLRRMTAGRQYEAPHLETNG